MIFFWHVPLLIFFYYQLYYFEKAELQIFNVFTRLFSKCVIEPVLDKNGEPEYPDLDNFDQNAIVSAPRKPIMRVVKRADAVIY